MNLVISIIFLISFHPCPNKNQSCLYQEIDRHLQCAMNFTKFLRNYQSIVAQFGYMVLVLNDSEQNILLKPLS